MKEFTASDYLQKLCDDLIEMCENGFPFYAYGILCQGIELLGGLFDTKNSFDDRGHSAPHFERGVKEIYGRRKYDKCRKELFEHLRGSLIHQLRPGTLFVLGSFNTGASEGDHLSQARDGRIVLVIEMLVGDFQKCVRSIVAEDSKFKGMIDQHKLEAPFLIVTGAQASDNRNSETVSLSGRPVDEACYTYKPPEEC
jgi:hypothetical protein